MTILDQSVDSMPAANLRAERLFLSACLVADAAQRDECLLLLQSQDFHDPWHQWLFVALRHCLRCDQHEMLRRVLEESLDRVPPIGGRSIAYEMAAMVYDRDGLPHGGQVARIRTYAADVKFAAALRAKQIELEKQLLSVLNEAEDYERDSTNDF